MKKALLLFTIISFFIYSDEMADKFSIKDFKLDRYLGTWYEIIRKDNYFEKNLDYVTATYSLKTDGKIEVLNKGFNLDKNKESEITGKARKKFDNVENILEVSFFGPFYSDYIIADFDRKNYSWALVLGEDNKNMWILSKEPQISEELTLKILSIAQNLGVDLSDLVYVKQKK